jgi:hypothetical protein
MLTCFACEMLIIAYTLINTIYILLIEVTLCLSITVIVVVFDLSSLMSLSHCPQWLEEGLSANSGSPHIFLVGTKRDLMVWYQIYCLVSLVLDQNTGMQSNMENLFFFPIQ